MPFPGDHIDCVVESIKNPMIYEDLDLDGNGGGDGREYHSPWELDRQTSGDHEERQYWRDMGA